MPNPMITFLVGKVHVGESNRAVVRYIRERFAKDRRYGRKGRRWRHSMYRAALKQHRANRALYRHVMGGGR